MGNQFKRHISHESIAASQHCQQCIAEVGCFGSNFSYYHFCLLVAVSRNIWYWTICMYTDLNQFMFADFPRVTVGPDNPLMVEQGDTAAMLCEVSYIDTM